MRGTPDRVGLTRGYVRRVLGWPRTKEGALQDPPDRRPVLSRADWLRRALFLRNWPAHRIEPAVQAQLAKEAAIQAGQERVPTETPPCVPPARPQPTP